MPALKKLIKKYYLVLEHLFYVLKYGKDSHYGEVGLFIKNNPITTRYSYANWGSRLWELRAVEIWLSQLGIKDKKIVDIGIGLPSDSDFYTFYVKAGCYLNAYDLDSRIGGQVELSDRCKIYNKSSDEMPENENNSVDVVVALSSLEHYTLESFNKTIQEVYRILKPGGLFLVTLDLTHDKKSAPWAILEKTLNNLPAEENSMPIAADGHQVTLENFIEKLSPLFSVKDVTIKNSEFINDARLLYEKKVNSYIGYIHFYKK